MARSVKPWRGKTHDTKAPPRVRQRVFDAHGGVCHVCKLPIKQGETWHLDHVIALIEGGENRETNLAPAHAHCNMAKANGEKMRKAKVQRTRQKHTGARKPKQTIQSRGFDRKERKPKPALPPKQLFRSQ
jgi:5-methylcytosine-specific restriction endonuclease McrA